MKVSIFNDVVGPVMRGASSSHCAAALRIGRLARDLMGGTVDSVLVEFDRAGALPTTHESQGSDMGLFGGLMGWEADDERLPDSPQLIRAQGTVVQIETVDVGDPHPNTYRLSLKNKLEEVRLTAISTGGGMIEVLTIDGTEVDIRGDYFETLVQFSGAANEIRVESVKMALPDIEEIAVHDGMVEVRSSRHYSDEEVGAAFPGVSVTRVRRLFPVLPVLSRRNVTVPFTTCAEMLASASDAPLWKLAVQYESARGNLAEEEVIEKMVEIVRILRSSISQGIAGTSYEDRILPPQTPTYRAKLESGKLLDGGMLNRIVLYVSALMEVKSSMGVLVAAPTAGACAAFPAAVIGACEELGLGLEDMAKAMLAGGLVGVFIATAWTFAAEVGGCQAEGGAAACMAAAALTGLAGGSVSDSVAAASIALQNMIGLICDPVAKRVEVPCLGKNVMAASNALACANMALAGFASVVPLDEVIETAKRVSAQMPRELRCTGLGGLAITEASQVIEKRLEARSALGLRVV
ncbi:MAG: L-serine ammonia-lyase, iron-sulfur-dependent, subunit alpha [Fimbriimonadaceae bacterium]